MKKKILIIVGISLLALSILGGGGYFVYTKFFEKDSADKATSYPRMEISLTQFPKKVNDVCESIVIKANIKNVGELPLTYQQILDKEYSFTLLLNTKLIGATDKDSVSVNDFGTIGLGETKEITIIPGESVEYMGESIVDNYFSRAADSVNGEFEIILDFYKVLEDNTFLGLGASSGDITNVSVYSDTTNRVLKSCGPF